MLLKRLACVLLIISCSSALAKTGTDTDDQTIGMVTGPKTGTYIAFGKDIAKEAAKEDIIVKVYESKGSVDNIKRITGSEKVSLAIVQSDVLGFLSRSKSEESLEAARKLRLVAPFYDEEVHILASKDIKTLQDLNGKKVVVGDEGSGSMITAVNIFSIMGISPANMYQIDPPRGVVAVLDKKVDAMIFVGGKPVKMFKNMEEIKKLNQDDLSKKLSEVHFLPLNDEKLRKEYKTSALTHNDYSYITEDVPTISVTALLVTYDYTMKKDAYYKAQCNAMSRLAMMLNKKLDDLREEGHPKWQEVDMNAEVINWKRDECTQHVMIDTLPPDKNLQNDLLSVVRKR